MKFTVEVEDFWIDEDGEGFDIEFKKYVKNEIKSEIWRSIKEKTEKEITEQLKQFINKRVESKITSFINKIFDKGNLMVAGSYSGDKPIPMKEYIVEKLKDKNGYQTPRSRIDKLAEQYADEIKKRYDLLFASQLVAKLGNHGLLKEDVQSLLLPQPNKEG